MSVAFVPLNSTEIAILGGRHNGIRLSEVITFNTSTNQFKREVEKGAFSFHRPYGSNQSAQFRENTIFAPMIDENLNKCLIKYTKGNTSVTRIPI